MTKARVLTLTEAHVARVQRPVAPQPIPPGLTPMTDADYADCVAQVLAFRPDQGGPLRLFAFGSLIWKPEIPHTAEAEAIAHGWHRAFCLRLARYRGTADLPGLMMGLVAGGQCRGVAYTLPDEDIPGQLNRLFRREFTAKPISNLPRWIKVSVQDQSVAALAFVANPASPIYMRGQTPAQIAAVLARACGEWGSGADYLLNTVQHLEARGIHDRMLWQLQRLVAAEIDALGPAAAPQP